MSACKGEGAVLFWRHQARIGSRPPFLRRNVRKSLEHLTMGQNQSQSAKSKDDSMTGNKDVDDFPNDRPAKRRRIFRSLENSSAPVNHVKDLTVSPTKFYAQSSAPSKSKKSLLDQPPEPRNFRQILRVDVKNILHVPDPTHGLLDEMPNFKGVQKIRCKCSVTISHSPDDSNREEDATEPTSVDLVKRVQVGFMELSYEHGQYKREFNFDPFFFPREEISVNQRINHRRRADSDGKYAVYDIADNYNISITVQCLGEQKLWPPIHTRTQYISPRISEAVLMQSNLPFNVQEARQRYTSRLYTVSKRRKEKSDHRIKVHASWSVPNRLPQEVQKVPIAEPIPIVVKETVEDSVIEDLPVENSQAEKGQDGDDEAREVLPESPAGARSTRGKVVNTYNLKTLSAQAQGKAPRSPRKRKADGSNNADGLQKKKPGPEITLCFHRTDAFENRTSHRHTFTGLQCPFCFVAHRTFDMLRFHWQTEHDHFRFVSRPNNISQQSYTVDVTKSRPGTELIDRTYQLGKSSMPFDLRKFLDGDDAWTRSRLGSENDHWAAHTIDQSKFAHELESSRSPSSRPSRYSTPNTSGSVDDVIDDVEKIMSNLQIPRTRRALQVPHTVKPLFHTVTKQLLRPGEELPESDEEMDEEWFFQLHRDLTNDFSDVTAGEKEYTHKWTPFAMKSDLQLPDTIAGFVEAHKDWFAESTSRRKWFMVHMGTLVRREVVTDKFVAKWVGVLGKAASMQNGKGVDAPAMMKPKRGTNECFCLEHVLGVDRVVCMGRVSAYS